MSDAAATDVRDVVEVREELASKDVGEVVDASGDGGVLVRRLRAPKAPNALHGGAQLRFVEVHYQGFHDDNCFDSSRESGYPFVVPLGERKVIAGWELALQVLRVGELAEVTVRADYAYGREGVEPDIPGNATLRFEIEVLDARATPKAVGGGSGASGAPGESENDEERSRLERIREEREAAAKEREEKKALQEEKKKKAQETAAMLANKMQQKGRKGKKK